MMNDFKFCLEQKSAKKIFSLYYILLAMFKEQGTDKNIIKIIKNNFTLR